MRILYFLSIAAFVVRQTSAFSPSPTRLAFRSPHTSGKAVPPILPNEVFTSVSKGLSSTYDDIPVNNRHAASDWLYNVRSFPQSKVLREIRNPLFCVAGWSFAVSLIQRIFSTSSSAPLRILGESICIPTAAHSFLVSSLGLLLVFRTNSAYQRFYEGRKIWENILSVSRNFSRITRLYAKEVGMDRKVRMMNLVAAYPYLLRHHIRHGCLCEEAGERIPEEHRLLLEDPLKTLETRFEGDKIDGLTRSNASPALPRDKCYVDKRKLPWNLFDHFSTQRLARTQNRPLWACDRIGREIMAIPYGPNFSSRERLVMLTAVDKLTNAIGECERIHQTAVPLNYARHSLRSLTLFLFTLPFALVKDMGFLTAPVTAGIAWLMFGVYQIGYSIEDPFQGSLRLSNLCDAIRKDVVGSIAEDMEDSYSSNQLGLWDEGVDEVTLAERAEDFLKTPMIIPTLLDQGISNLSSSASVDASKPPY